jgi:class 3 adenylate cyclase
MATVFHIFLSELDIWVMDVPPEALKARLDWLCDRVNSICRPAGGEIEQVLGHGLMVRFPGDRAGVVQATRCALQLLEETTALGGQAQAGIHHGVDVSGVFGPAGTLMHAGEAVAVAKAASEFARPGALYGGEPICDVMSSEAGIEGIALGPHFVRGVAEAVSLFELRRRPGGQP